MTNPYDADYYLNGPATGRSNYDNYRWMPERTLDFAHALIRYLGVSPGETLLDYGTARGYTVKALRILGVNAFGYDISEWAIANCDPAVVDYVSDDTRILSPEYDHVLAKDVFEHMDVPLLRSVADHLLSKTRRSMLVIVPLSFVEGTDYVRQEDNQDATHLIRWPLTSWLDFFQNRAGHRFTVSGSWHVDGLKPTSFSHLKSCGFLLLERVATGS